MENLSLGQKQRKFAEMVGQLLTWIYQQPGLAVTLGDAMATEGHMANSLHYSRLAIDLNLFVDNVYQTTGDAHGKLHDFWDSIGGSPRIANDLNHYSFSHDGRR